MRECLDLDIKWVGSPNYGLPRGEKGRRGHKVIAIVDHIMAGTLTGTDSWFNNRVSGASAHFGVGKKGQIHQYVSLDNAAWHAGHVRKPSWNLLIPDANPNYYTIGIEHEGQPGDIMTEEQFQATLSLHKWLIKEYGLAVTNDTIIGHYRIDSVQKANCPGPSFPWERLFEELKKEPGPFVDVTRDHWAAESVKRVLQEGLMSGYPDGTFKGEKDVSRYELASTIDRLLQKLK